MNIIEGDCVEKIGELDDDSISLSIWSPPYFVGKTYEQHLSYETWRQLLTDTIAAHTRIIKPGGFIAINIADILCFADPTIPRFAADMVSARRSPVTREQILAELEQDPDATRSQLATKLGCSEQTIHRRLEHNNVRGGKQDTQTRIELVAGIIGDAALSAGFTVYDRRIWVKDPAWANSRWHATSYRAVDEFEYIFILWKPGVTVVDRTRLTPDEWSDWGSRGVWTIRSVKCNDDHEAKFPIEIPRRLIRLLSDPGDHILDPFAGSGTTGIAAAGLGRDFTGIELDPDYVKLARRSLPEPAV